ncbi:MAG: hypothetical protein IJZ90_04185, partial [Clostridia bacterium]|nr:hypothetical protein [Clostridia bacterium]
MDEESSADLKGVIYDNEYKGLSTAIPFHEGASGKRFIEAYDRNTVLDFGEFSGYRADSRGTGRSDGAVRNRRGAKQRTRKIVRSYETEDGGIITEYSDGTTETVKPEERVQGKKKIKPSLKYTVDNKAVVVIEDDILANIPKSEWVSAVKGTIKNKFSEGIPVSGRLVKVNLKTRNEFTNSKNTQNYRNRSEIIYKDKFKSANNLDEIVLASTNYVNEDLNHERKDNFKEFARGDVLMRIGRNDYSAKVIVGFTAQNEMVLYDVINFTPTTITLKKADVSSPAIQKQKTSSSTSADSKLSQDVSSVNNNSTQNTKNNSQKIQPSLKEKPPYTAEEKAEYYMNRALENADDRLHQITDRQEHTDIAAAKELYGKKYTKA